MTAKPQPMAGKSDAADDLIAELAKLMARDANDAPPPKPMALSPFTVRIPGDAAVAPRHEEPVRRAETTLAPVSVSHVRTAEPERQQPVPAPAPAAPNPPRVEADSGRFAFDATQSRREPASMPAPTPPAVPVASEPAAPVRVEPETTPPEHDSIADLIAAELAIDPHPSSVVPTPPPAAPVPVPEVPAPVLAAPEAMVTEEPPQPKPAPDPRAGWQPVDVSSNREGARPAQSQLRPVTSQPVARQETPRTEQDAFKVPPVFGLGTTPVPQPVQAKAPEPVRIETAPKEVDLDLARAPVSAPAMQIVAEPSVKATQVDPHDTIGSDPIDEIENLIGKAVRVDLDVPRNGPQIGERPALRSLATPLPRTAAPTSRPVSSADETIMAAAQASGAEVDWVEAPQADEPEPRRVREKRRFAMPRFGFSRVLAGPLVALTLLLAAGFGLYWVLGMGGGETGPAPLLTADATPVKETPVAQPEPAAEQQSVVFNEMEGVVPGAEEQLVSRDQADLNEVTQVPPAPDVSSEGLANRKVRTVTVRPDGTIVSADNSLAGSTILPVARPNVPEIAGAQTASPELLANANPVDPVPPAGDGLAAAPPAPGAASTAVPNPTDAAAIPPLPSEPVAPPVPVVTPGATVPAVDASGNALAGRTSVIPLQRPANLAQRPQAAIEAPPLPNSSLDPAQAATAELPLPPAGQPSPTVPGATEVAALPDTAPAYVQLASQRTEEEARATAQRLVTRFGPLFGGANMEVQRIDLGTRGIFYRVRVPANSTEQATNICVNVKAAGGDCITM